MEVQKITCPGHTVNKWRLGILLSCLVPELRLLSTFLYPNASTKNPQERENRLKSKQASKPNGSHSSVDIFWHQ